MLAKEDSTENINMDTEIYWWLREFRTLLQELTEEELNTTIDEFTKLSNLHGIPDKEEQFILNFLKGIKNERAQN